MKKILITLLFFQLALIACVDKKDKNKEAATINTEQIIELEKENSEIEVLEQDINKDLEELDKLINDLEI